MTDDMTRSFLLVAKGLGSPHVLIPISSNLSIPLNGFPSEKSKPMSKAKPNPKPMSKAKPNPKPSTNTSVVSDTSKATSSNDKEVSPESLISDKTDVITTSGRSTRSKVNDANKSVVLGGDKPVTDEEDKEEDSSNTTKENNRDEEVKANTTKAKPSSKKRKSS
eukprot:CAMPEP_0184854710 /NCGR_PEP_ID=MMETSP0580-20130426/87_1 /TAXON_ID=1118495 /ORGANISM="Dactyliosolen fragilissimus" /LENGTH=163 /DNA_ID=CAMNT_0027349013 /DNA_START=93 /DNA_END=580 /DNA_ORIENTATION=-